ncbi:uncharacterized protein [Labrus bergylta]|uniref:uncharacterized protein n=1 Tax=Labrus bergylta TaxID=56723 RepID=UPI0033137055
MAVDGDDVTLSCNYSGSAKYLYWYQQKSGNTLEDDITASSAEVFSSEGHSVTLSCKYSVKANNLQWYQQYPGSAPQFLLLISDTSDPTVVTAKPPHPRLTVKLNKERNRVDLQISSAVLTDSAVYYCALQPTQHLTSTNMEQLTVILFFSVLIGVSCEDLTPVKTEEHSLEDSTVTLSYSYSKQADGNDYFFWYQQYPGKQPEFIMFISGLNFTKTAESLKSEKRFWTRLSEEKDRVDLQISSAALTDSAVYYCALRPTSVKEKTE